MKRNSQELLLGGTRARGNHRFRETRLAAAIALGMALVGAPCLTQAQDANTDAPATTAPESAAMAPSKKNTAAKPDVSEMGAITVTGIRASLMSAQSLKQNADQIIDSVTATDINALPDRSVTETLQRISGVTVDHFLADDDPNHPAAEGSGVLIRGLPYVGSLLNGRTSFSANNGRALGFQDVPAELMAGVDVYKNPSAEIIEGGIGGTVNLRTRMPFDTGKTTAFSFGINDGDMAKKHKPAASFLYSNVWESDTYGKFGALFDVAISELSTRSDGVQVQPYVLRPTKTDGPDTWLQDADGNWRNDLGATVADGAPNGEGYVPGGVNWRRMDMDRRRIGL
jgi:TonB-dependent receptor